MNNDVSTPVETAIQGIPGLESTTATSTTNASIIQASFTYGTDLATADLIDAGLVPGDELAGDAITAAQARRLACTARIIPAVLGGKSEVLDLGREARLFNAPQRTAMEIRDKTCTEVACTMPAAYCEAHHPHPWSEGGQTNLADDGLTAAVSRAVADIGRS